MSTSAINYDQLAARYTELMQDGSKPVYGTLHEEFGSSVRSLQRAVKRLRDQGRLGDPAVHSAPTQKIQHGADFVEATSSGGIRSLEDLLEACDADLSKYTVTSHKIGAWGEPGNERWTAWAKFGLRDQEDALRGLKDGVLEELRRAAPTPPHRRFRAGGQLLEVGLFDMHVGNLAWAEETGENWDLDIAEKVFRDAVENLLYNAEQKYDVGRVLYPIGNDFFHMDTKAGTTTSGTQVDYDTRLQKMFRRGVSMQIWAIDQMRRLGPVDVVVVPGNHDELSSFMMGEVLKAWFHNDHHVSVDNRAALRKYYRYGRTLLGFTHGKWEKTNQLPQLMAVEAADEWGMADFREFHIGHRHHRRAERYVDNDGVLVRMLPTLCASDSFHATRGFTAATKAAEAYIFDDSHGLIGTLHHQRAKL